MNPVADSRVIALSREVIVQKGHRPRPAGHGPGGRRGTRIVAPLAGTVVAVNGQPGETADPDGVRDDASELVPAAGISGVPGRIQELLARPLAAYQGTGYEAVVTVFDRHQDGPPTGMTANVQPRS